MTSKKEKRKKAKKTLRKYLGIKGKITKPEEGWTIDGKGIRYTKRF